MARADRPTHRRLDSPVLVAALLSLGACRRAPPRAPRAPSRARDAPVALTTPPAPPPPLPRWTESFSLRCAPARDAALPDVTVHVPEGFDPRGPIHVVVVLHGMGGYAQMWIGSGMQPAIPGRPPVLGWGLDQRFDHARINAILVAPQFIRGTAQDWYRWFSRRGAFRAFLDEVLRDIVGPRVGRALSADAVGTVSLTASSAGGYATAAIVSAGDLNDRLRGVALIDALYMDPSPFARWLAASPMDPSRRFIAVHGGGAWTSAHGARMLALTRGVFPGAVTADPSVGLAAAIRANRVVIAHSGVEHVTMHNFYFEKILGALGLPRRPWRGDGLDPKGLRGADPPASGGALHRGISVRGELDDADARLHDSSLCEDWSLDLDAGAPAVLVVRGGPERYYGSPLDVIVQVLRDGRVVAEDDDGGGGFTARLSFTAPAAARYTVRVTTHGPWARAGTYSLRVE